jgi:hypothetical protein
MAEGVPDAAFEPIEGDDKKTASSLKKRNKKEAAGQMSMVSGWSKPATTEVDALRDAVAALDAAPDGDAMSLAAKEAGWAELQGTPAWRHAHLVADAWCAAFVWPKPAGGGAVVEAAPTDALWRDLRDGKGQISALLLETVAEVVAQYGLFHWHLAFPTVFGRGGFDVVLGNPPWERVKLQEQEFFASRSPEIAGAVNAAARKRLIAALPATDPALWVEWCAASREAEGQSQIVRETGRYPLCGKGDVNTYALFAEHNRSVLGPRGRAGFIVPTGIATDDTTKEYFGDLIAQRHLAAFYGFENEAKLFAGIDHRVNFCLMVLSSAEVLEPEFSAFIRHPSVLAEPGRVYRLTAVDIALVNPNTRTCPIFRSRRDADINLALYRRAGVLWREGKAEHNPWGLRFMAMLHMANDSGLFRTRSDLQAAAWEPSGNCFVRGESAMVPLLEAKMLYHFNHRFGDFALLAPGEREHILPQVNNASLGDPAYTTMPRYWVDRREVNARLPAAAGGWLLGWRDVTDARSSVRTVVASLVPRAAVGDTFLLVMPDRDPTLVAVLYGSLCSLVVDYAARQKVGGTHLKYHVFKQLPILAPAAYELDCSWSPANRVAAWLLPRVLELTYTAWDLEAFAHDVGCDGPPFRWDPARRTLLRAELDAAFFHLYGLNRDDTDYILDTFPIVRKNDEKAHGEYRTKRLILEVYDGIAKAIRTGQPYQTCLDPVPAHPSVAHDPSTRPAWAKAET